jgi:hypothetical protein
MGNGPRRPARGTPTELGPVPELVRPVNVPVPVPENRLSAIENSANSWTHSGTGTGAGTFTGKNSIRGQPLARAELREVVDFGRLLAGSG